MAVAGYAALMAGAVFGALAWASRLGMDAGSSVTVTFLTLAFAQLWHVFNARGRRSSLLAREVAGNLYVWGALGLCAAMLLLAVYVPPVARALRLVDPGVRGWGVVAAMSLAPLAAGRSCGAPAGPLRRRCNKAPAGTERRAQRTL